MKKKDNLEEVKKSESSTALTTNDLGRTITMNGRRQLSMGGFICTVILQ